MATAWRPTLRQMIELAGEIHQMPVSELATPAVLRRTRTALATPNAEVFGQELFPSVPAKAQALTGALLANPPLAIEAPRLACQTLRGFLRRNGWRWRGQVTATIVRFQAEMRSGEIGPDLAQWIEDHAAPDHSSRLTRPSANGMRLFSADDLGSNHVVYQAGPVAGLGWRGRRLQATLSRAIEEAVAATAETGTTALSVDSPGIHLSRERVPGLTDRELWHRNRLCLLCESDALVVIDVGSQRAGFGSAMEVDLMALQGGPMLYLRSRGGEGCSRYLVGRGDELDLCICDYSTPAEARELTQAWLTERVNAIAEAGRRRADRVFANELLLRRLAPAYARLESMRKMFVCGSLGLTPTSLEVALEHPATTDLILGDRLAAFCDLLGLEESVSDGTLGGSFSDKPRADTLIEAAREMGWSAPTIQRLWSDAVVQSESAGNVSRFSYYSRTDWIKRERASH